MPHRLLEVQSWWPWAPRITSSLLQQHRGSHLCMAAASALHSEVERPARAPRQCHVSSRTSASGCLGCNERRVGRGWRSASQAPAVEACRASSYGPISQARDSIAQTAAHMLSCRVGPAVLWHMCETPTACAMQRPVSTDDCFMLQRCEPPCLHAIHVAVNARCKASCPMLLLMLSVLLWLAMKIA